MRALGRFLILVSATALAPTPAVAAETLRVTIDTSGLTGTFGTVTFGFSSPLVTGPGSFNATGTATISNFFTDGSLVGASGAGNTSGGLPGTVILTNLGGTTNFYSIGELFGTQNVFDLTIASTSVCPTAMNCSQPEFTVALNDARLGSVILDRNGFLGTGGTSRISFSIITSAVPEPGTWAMMLVGFGAVGFSMRRQRRVLVRSQTA